MERVLVVGSGAREHALAHKLCFGNKTNFQPKREVLVLGGNAGIALDFECIRLPEQNHDYLVKHIKKISPDLVVIGPENYLAEGLEDALNHQNIKVFGPSKNASQLESSKFFTKQICQKAQIPHAAYEKFSDYEDAFNFIDKYPSPELVIKVDGLCAGKGVFVCKQKEAAFEVISNLYQKDGFLDLGVSDRTIIIEDFLDGHEVSVFGAALHDEVALFSPMQDYKRLLDFDQGPNTGGMGAVGPLGSSKQQVEQFLDRIKQQIFIPALSSMKGMNMPFAGLLYAGLMLTKNGVQLLEFNVRFGDPETQALLYGLHADIYPLLRGIAYQEKIDFDFWQQALLNVDPTVSVVLASKGYPFKSCSPAPITVPKQLPKNTTIYFGKTDIDGAGKLLSGQGRVLNVVASGKTIEEAARLCYSLVSEISFLDMQYRSDIGTKITELKLL